MDLVRVKLDGRWIGARDMLEQDIDQFVSYWHDGVADLEFLGIDLAKLGSRDDTRRRFLAMCRRDGVVGYTFYDDDRVIGYTNINLRGGARGYVHVHLTDPQARSRGILSSIFQHALPAIAQRVLVELPIDVLVLETRTRNQGINRVVEKTGLRPDFTGFLQEPDGLAGPGEFNVFELDRARITALLAATKSVPAMEFTK